MSRIKTVTEGHYTVMITCNDVEHEEIWEFDEKGDLLRNKTVHYNELYERGTARPAFFFENESGYVSVKFDFQRTDDRLAKAAFVGKIHAADATKGNWVQTGEYVAIKSQRCPLCRQSKSFERSINNDPCKNCD